MTKLINLYFHLKLILHLKQIITYKKTGLKAYNSTEAYSQYNGVLVERLDSLEDIKATCSKDYQFEIINKKLKEYINISLDKEKYNVGEIFVAETAAGIFMIKVVDITSDYINAKKANLIDDCFEEILLDYFKDVKVNQTLIDSIKV